MKIHPYLTVVQSQRTSSPRRTVKTAEDAEFKVETQAPRALDLTAGGQELPRDTVRIVSLENRRALEQEPPSDLSEAEAILNKVQDQLRNMTRADLRNVHRLEGLVHVYPE